MCGRVCRQGRAGGAVILLSQPQAIFCVGYSRWYFAFLCSAVGSAPPGVWARYAAGTGGGRWDTGSGITGLLQPPLPPANAWTRLPPLKKKKKYLKIPVIFLGLAVVEPFGERILMRFCITGGRKNSWGPGGPGTPGGGLTKAMPSPSWVGSPGAAHKMVPGLLRGLQSPQGCWGGMG